MSSFFRIVALSVVGLFLTLGITPASAQTTEFTYQGSLNNGASPASGNYDVEIDVFDAAVGGNYFNTITASNIPVVNGIFSLKLDLGANIFPGSPRFLHVKVRQSGGSVWTILSPRQQVTSVPYAVQSLNAANAANAAQLGGIAASQFVQTSDPRLTDARTPLPGSDNYIRNMPVGQGQTGANFWVTGIGKANILEAEEYRVFNSRILAGTTNGSNNLLVGIYANLANGGGFNNSFIGYSAGRNQTTGSGNTFTGSWAGQANTTGSNNSYYGSQMGYSGGPGSTGNFNSTFGHRSGEGLWNSSGSLNSFFGTGSGFSNSTGSSNMFAGHDSGSANTTGSFNTTIGENADLATGNLTNATAIGSKSFVAQSNSLVLGSINGVNGATADTNVGIGTTTPANKLHVNGTIRVTNGAVYITNPNTLIITSPNGACWGITVNNSGGLATFPVTPCP